MIADRIKDLRIQHNLTQAELAKKLNITRSSVNAWEMGISTPSTAYLIELAQLFHVSTDYLLGLSATSTLDISSLNEEEINIVYSLIEYFRSKKQFYPEVYELPGKTFYFGFIHFLLTIHYIFYRSFLNMFSDDLRHITDRDKCRRIHFFDQTL